MHWPFPATQIWVCPVQWTMDSDLIMFLRLLCSTKGCGKQLNPVLFMAEWCRKSGFLIWLCKPISKEFLMLAACALYLKKESQRTKLKVCLPFLALSACTLHFIPNHLRFGVCLLIWQHLTKPVATSQLPSINQPKGKMYFKISPYPVSELLSLSLP